MALHVTNETKILQNNKSVTTKIQYLQKYNFAKINAPIQWLFRMSQMDQSVYSVVFNQ